MITCLITIGCKAQRPKTEEMTDKKTEKEIKEEGYGFKKNDTIFVHNGKLDIAKIEELGSTGGTTKPPYYQYEDYLDDNIIISISGDSESGYGKNLKFKKDSSFEYGYSYYPSGKIRIYGVQYISFFKKGTWYWFSEAGDIEKYEDYDAPYKFSWEDVKLFLKEHKIKEEDINQIGRAVEPNGPVWYVSFKTPELKNTDNVEQYILNGTTGEVLKKELLNISRELD